MSEVINRGSSPSFAVTSQIVAPNLLSKNDVRQIAVNAGIPPEMADRLLNGGELVLRDDGRIRVTLRIVLGDD